MKKIRIGMWMFMFSVNVLWGQAPQLPPVPRGTNSAANGLEVGSASKHDVSPALRDISQLLDSAAIPEHQIFRGRPHPDPKSTSPDGAVQASSGPDIATTAGLNILGVGQGFVGPSGAFQVRSAPPDTNGAVGDSQYVQWVNASFAVFDKATGAAVFGPAAGNTLWSGFGGGCETNNSGDIIAEYDKRANRWIMAQPAYVSPYLYCIAVSTSSDATGTYNRYAFAMPNFPDYPKLAVWPNGYFAAFNMFNGTAFLGARACAFDKVSMMAGAPSTYQCAQLSPSFDSLLPSDLDGTFDPPAQSPDFYVNLGTNSLNLWQFHPDWVNPANSTFVGPANIPVAPFSEACGGGICIPQSGTAQTLDSLGDRLMYRLAYRAFDNGSGPPSCCYQSLVAVHSVTVGNLAGLRWYELRTSQGSIPTVFQQGTYAPDSSFRWMGSIGMDRAGDIALGYSVSNSSMHPAIRYTGRIPTDALGTLETENSIVEGGGSQLSNLERWGDYSSINIDPLDDCTFWYTNEYLQTDGTFNWSTRIGSFKFPNCVASNLPPSAVSATPSSGSGASQVFSFVYSDPNGAADLNVGFVVIGTLSANSCVAGYTRSSNQLVLLNDAASSWLGPATLGTAGTLQNSQCTVSLPASSASSFRTNLTLNLALTFTPAFLGTQNIYMYAADNSGLNSGLQPRGSWTVTPAVDHAPQAVSVMPSPGSGSSQVFNFLYSDPDGFVDLSVGFVFINSTVSAANGCVAAYIRSSNQLLLLNDAGSTWLGPATPGAAGTLQNSQCTVSLPTSSTSSSGTNLTLNLALTFTQAFLGPQNVYMYAADNAGLNSGWQPRGNWTVTPAVDHPPQAVSVTPSSGSGSSQVFNFLYSDPDGFVDLSAGFIVINSTLSATNGCVASYIRSSNQLLLLDDAGSTWLGPATPGAAGTLQNSQCTVSLPTSSVSSSGTNLTLNLALTFKPPVTGTQNVFMYAADSSGQSSGWQTRGSWTVP